MNPGSALDALIAEKVMGWKPKNNAWVRQEFIDADVVRQFPPPYSTDIAAAWEVVQHMRQGSFRLRDRFEDELRVAVSQRLMPQDERGMHFKAIPIFMEPVDICLAALKAFDERT